MECPYPDCSFDNIQQSENRCTACGRPIKRCASETCYAPNRSFACYCKSCGIELPESETNWSMFKGNSQRRGISPISKDYKFAELTLIESGSLMLSDRCQSLLIYDHYLIAVSEKGHAAIANLHDMTQAVSVHLGGVYAEPAIHRGVLYIGARQDVRAYALGKLMAAKEAKPEWIIPIQGNPIDIMPIDNNVFILQGFPDGHYEIKVIETETRSLKPIYKANRISMLTGSARSKRVYFFSENQNGIFIHSIDASKYPPRVSDVPVKSPPSTFRENIPIALIGVKVFIVFKEEDRLSRVDAETGEIDRKLCKQVKDFAIAGLYEPIAKTSRGLLIQEANYEIPLTEIRQTIKCPPLILKDRAIVLGMNDGAIHLYDIHNPGMPIVQPISNQSNSSVTSVAGFDNFIATGNEKGYVKVFRLHQRGTI